MNEEINCVVAPTPYTLKKRVGPPKFTNFVPEFDKGLLEKAFRKDIAWSLCGILDDEDLPLLGSWTPFNKLVSGHESEKIVQEYLPVTPHPPEYPVCKEYLDFLLNVIEELEIPLVCVQLDGMVYRKF